MEKLGGAPHIRGIHGHIDGHIADKLDLLFHGVSLQRIPLFEEQILQKHIEVHIFPQVFGIFSHGLRPAQADVLIPLDPTDHIEMGLYRHEEGIVLDPLPVFFSERGDLFLILGRAPGKGLPQHREAVIIDAAVVHSGRVAAPGDVFNLRGLQKSVFDQHVQVDIIGVSRKSGEGGIGAVPVAGGAQRQKLPVFLPSRFQKINKLIGALPHGSDPVMGREGAHGHEDTAAAFHFHPSFSSILIARPSSWGKNRGHTFSETVMTEAARRVPIPTASCMLLP